MYNSIVKVAIFENDIFPYLKAYSSNFFLVPLGHPNVKKYGLIENNMLFMVSQNSTMTHNGGMIYNIMLTVMPNQKETTKTPQQCLKRFEESMPFEFLSAPKTLVTLLSKLDFIKGEDL